MASIACQPKRPKLEIGKCYCKQRKHNNYKLKSKNQETKSCTIEEASFVEDQPREIKDQPRKIKVPFCKDGEVLKDRWESKPRFMVVGPHYRYSLVVRPNGLRCTDGYGKAIGIWFRPLPSLAPSNDDAKVKLSISILSKSGNTMLTTDEKDFEWDEEQTMSPYPASKFDLMAFKHSEVEQKNCIDDEGRVTVIINEH